VLGTDPGLPGYVARGHSAGEGLLCRLDFALGHLPFAASFAAELERATQNSHGFRLGTSAMKLTPQPSPGSSTLSSANLLRRSGATEPPRPQTVNASRLEARPKAPATSIPSMESTQASSSIPTSRISTRRSAPEVVNVGVRDSTQVLDGLLHHESNLRIVPFAPRIRDLSDTKLYLPNGKVKYQALAPMTGGTINLKAIRTHWNEILRLATSMKQGTVTASLMLRS
jgi:hypothetical protein